MAVYFIFLVQDLSGDRVPSCVTLKSISNTLSMQNLNKKHGVVLKYTIMSVFVIYSIISPTVIGNGNVNK